jgi:hypothetical protein
MGHRWVVDQGVCDHFERLIEVMERKEGWKEGRLEGRKGNGSQGFCGRKLIAREVPAVHVKGPRLGAFPIQPYANQSSKSHSKRGARKGQNTKTLILPMPDLTTNY